MKIFMIAVAVAAVPGLALAQTGSMQQGQMGSPQNSSPSGTMQPGTAMPGGSQDTNGMSNGQGMGADNAQMPNDSTNQTGSSKKHHKKPKSSGDMSSGMGNSSDTGQPH